MLRGDDIIISYLSFFVNTKRVKNEDFDVKFVLNIAEEYDTMKYL